MEQFVVFSALCASYANAFCDLKKAHSGDYGFGYGYRYSAGNYWYNAKDIDDFEPCGERECCIDNKCVPKSREAETERCEFEGDEDILFFFLIVFLGFLCFCLLCCLTKREQQKSEEEYLIPDKRTQETQTTPQAQPTYPIQQFQGAYPMHQVQPQALLIPQNNNY